MYVLSGKCVTYQFIINIKCIMLAHTFPNDLYITEAHIISRIVTDINIVVLLWIHPFFTMMVVFSV